MFSFTLLLLFFHCSDSEVNVGKITIKSSTFSIGFRTGVPNLFLTMYPSAFRQMSMYPYGIWTDKDVPFQNFDR